MSASHTRIGKVSERFLYKALISLVSLCLWASPAIAAEGPQAVIQNGTNQVISILRQYPVPSRARTQQIEAVIERYFDFERMARTALGPEWKSVSPEQRREFTNEFKTMLLFTYIRYIEKYAGQSITFFTQALSPDYARIEAAIYNEGNPIYLDYFLRLNGANWKVYDVIVSGMSLALSYRHQFDSFLANKSFDDLLMGLKEKNERVCRNGRC